MRYLTLTILFILAVGCTNDYEKGLKHFKEHDYENAILCFNTIDSGEQNFENAKIKLLQIENMIDSISFYRAKYEFDQKNFKEAKLLFSGFGSKSHYFFQSKKYLFVLEMKSKYFEDKQKVLDENEFNYTKIHIVKLYKELLDFKSDPEFKDLGFAVNHKYNQWLIEIEDIQKNKKITDRLYDEGYPVVDLYLIGMEYRLSGGKETDFTRYVKAKYSGI